MKDRALGQATHERLNLVIRDVIIPNKLRVLPKNAKICRNYWKIKSRSGRDLVTSRMDPLTGGFSKAVEASGINVR